MITELISTVKSLLMHGASSAPERMAINAFKHANPRERVASTRIAASQSDRFIIGVFFGAVTPPHCKLYSVSQDLHNVHELTDEHKYRPKNW